MKKILIVEDDLVMQSLYEDMLTSEGFIVDKASSGTEADGKLADETYDLVLMDVLLPGMNGVELLKKVKADKSHRNTNSRMLLLTALDDERIANNALQHGAAGYLLKFKMDPGQVLSKVKEELVN